MELSLSLSGRVAVEAVWKGESGNPLGPCLGSVVSVLASWWGGLTSPWVAIFSAW